VAAVASLDVGSRAAADPTADRASAERRVRPWPADLFRRVNNRENLVGEALCRSAARAIAIRLLTDPVGRI
jgi:hypothetical protein